MRTFTAAKLIADRSEYERITSEMAVIAAEMAAGDLSRRDTFRLMGVLCDAYDREHAATLPAAKSHELLDIALEAHGLRQMDMIGLLGDAAAVSSILAGRRPIPRAAAHALKERFGYDFPGLIAAEAVARAAANRRKTPARPARVKRPPQGRGPKSPR